MKVLHRHSGAAAKPIRSSLPATTWRALPVVLVAWAAVVALADASSSSASAVTTTTSRRRATASRGEAMARGQRSGVTAATSSLRSTRAVRPLSLPVVVGGGDGEAPMPPLRRRLGADKTVGGGGGTVPTDDGGQHDDAILPSPATAAPTPVPTPLPTAGINGGGGGGTAPPPPPTSSAPVNASNGPPPPTSAPANSSNGNANGGGAGGGGGETGTQTTTSVSLLDFVVQYDASQQTESQVLESLNATLTNGFTQQYPTTKRVRLEPNDGTTQSGRSSGGEANRRRQSRRSLQEAAPTSMPVSGRVVFAVSSDQPAPSQEDVHSLQTSLLQEWQQSTASGTVTFPQAQGPSTNPDGGGSSSASKSTSSSSNAGTIVGVVVALLVVGVVAAALVVRRYRRNAPISSSSRNRDHLQVEILSEINDDSHDGDDENGIREKRSMEHAECDIEIEQLDASSKNGGGIVMVTTSPTSVAYAQFNPDEHNNNNGGRSPDSVFLASSVSSPPHDAVSVASRGAFSTSTTVAASLTDTETKKGQSRALSSLLTFFARQSKKKDDAASVASSITSPRPIQWIEPEEKKDEEEVEVALPPPPALTTLPDPPVPFSPPVSPFTAISPAASVDSMENYSLASASFGPQTRSFFHHPAADKWIAPARARAPSVESYHSDTESMFTSGGDAGSTVVSEAAVLAPSTSSPGTEKHLYSMRVEDPPAHSSLLLGRSASDETNEYDDGSVDEIMGRASRRTPTRSNPVVKQKASPTSVVSSMNSPPKSRFQRGSGRAVHDEDEPFDETLEDEQDLELFAAELERAKKANPHASLTTRSGDTALLKAAVSSDSSTGRGSLLKAAVSSDSSNSRGNSSGAHEETLSGYLRQKVGEARHARNEAAAPPPRPRRGISTAKAAAL